MERNTKLGEKPNISSFKVMPWLRKIRKEDSERYYNNPELLLEDMKKIKDPRGGEKLAYRP